MELRRRHGSGPTCRHSTRWLAAPVLALPLSASPALAHARALLAPNEVWTAWTFQPAIVVPLLLAALLYARGVGALWRRSGVGHGVRRREAAAFAAGWLALVVALVSPLHALGEVLFAAHMAQHEVLMLVAAPLLVLGRPLIPFLWGMPPRWRRAVGASARVPVVRRAWRALTAPLTAWMVSAAAVWIWHLPRLYDATLTSESVHALQHVSFLGSALLFWWVLVHARRRALPAGLGVLYLFTTAVHQSVLGALLTFAPTLWYPAYATHATVWGLTPLEDQQLAGLIMWIPGGIVFLVAALIEAAALLRDGERRVAVPS